jgi:glutamate synthase domain-containing protein 2/glutamate synthase domain-containing protein 1/glutamate synthase domain-containing protein 3
MSPDACPQTEQTLYDPVFEHDACGVGLVCRLDATPDPAVVRDALSLLRRLGHRAGHGCDPETGDGAGILLQLPDAFLREAFGPSLPQPGDYGVGMVFLPLEAAACNDCQDIFSAALTARGLKVLGWRPVTVQPEAIGPVARDRMPGIWQVLVGRGDAVEPDRFEQTLYVARRACEKALGERYPAFYVASLSSRTLVYKGMLTVDQVPAFFPELQHPSLASAVAMVHSRFSTNTFPRWSLAQPFRYLCHNGEINTLRGNIHWMKAREPMLRSTRLGADLDTVLPVLNTSGSDSQMLDNALELLCQGGRSLPHAMMMLLPSAWEHHREMREEVRAFYEYHSSLMEPWDGPAAVPFTDGRYVGAMLDRNGLRPARYTLTRDGRLILGSEAGLLPVAAAEVVEAGRLQPGRMLLVDLAEKRLVPAEELLETLSRRQPYRVWLHQEMPTLHTLPAATLPPVPVGEDLHRAQRLFGYTTEDLRMILSPMVEGGEEASGSMGDDTPLAVLSDQPRLLYDYFRQLFAQVTNPPLDAIREALVTSLATYLGPERNLLEESPAHAHQLRLDQPVLTDEDLARIMAQCDDQLRPVRLSLLFTPGDDGGLALQEAVDTLCRQAAAVVSAGAALLILSDRDADADRLPIPALLATAAVHHHLIRTGQRMQCGLIVETGEAREVHHCCLLLGYGAGAVNPYLALATVRSMVAHGQVQVENAAEAVANYLKALGKGILKVMSKMGISTLQSYRGAQMFEAVGLRKTFVDAHFTGTVSRLEGIAWDEVALEGRMRHERAWGPAAAILSDLPVGGRYQWRRDGEHHQFNPHTLYTLRHAVREGEAESYEAFARQVNDQARRLGTLRGLLEFVEDPAQAVPLAEVEPWTEIVRRFKTGAMSYGSISEEAHETLALAMNALGGKSNTGEGGEPPERYDRNSPRRSRIKQVASGRFGVTIAYLASADEIQIKIAQGAKPGEGGQLPGHKVYPWIARTRHSTPWVGLISPPPHHDIYSIEDLAQLIFDLRQSNPQARISVKLVSGTGVGTVAAGIAKGKADVVLISGHDGGTGASPQTSIAHAGLPWELGLAETHQTLRMNGLRQRIRVEVDGQLKTGRDVAVAALLGADEFGFSTAPLVALGCVMMRKCHLNTCPVGIATQNPDLRRQFSGTPEHVINYFHFVAEELRGIMARLGFRTLDEMTGRTDRLRQRPDISHWKARHLDLAPLLGRPAVPALVARFDHAVETAVPAPEQLLDMLLIEQAQPALEHRQPVQIACVVQNTDRAFGTRLSHAITQRCGSHPLPEDALLVKAVGEAGQSFGAFGAAGLTLHLEGVANDHVGKGLSGARLVVVPPADNAVPSPLLLGNVALYGATSGELYARGRAGERFAVRNSGANAVVEGVGDHGCEYMTGGRVVVLGPTGRNFAAGMSGGIAYVFDPEQALMGRHRCNTAMVEVRPVTEAADVEELLALIVRHHACTGSAIARWVLDHPEAACAQFVQVLPHEYRLARLRAHTEVVATRTHLAA